MDFLIMLGDCNKHTMQELVHKLEVSDRTIRRYRWIAENYQYKIHSQKGRYAYYQVVFKPKL